MVPEREKRRIQDLTPDDTRLDDYRNLPDAALLEERGIFIAEGRLVVRRLLASERFATRSVMLTEPALHSLADLLEATRDLAVYLVPQTVMSAITGFNIHRGCLAIGVRRPEEPWQQVAHQARRLVLLEGIANADNVGGIFRNAAAFGADAVLLDGASTDPLYRKAIRTSMGAALSVPFARAVPWLDALDTLSASRTAVIGMTPAADAAPLADVAARLADRPAAIVVGHEGHGLQSATLERCDYKARIPMAPGTDSLNVATAAAIALYELGK